MEFGLGDGGTVTGLRKETWPSCGLGGKEARGMLLAKYAHVEAGDARD